MRASLALIRRTDKTWEVLLGHKNIYLPPRPAYQFAAIARSAAQYVLPGGAVGPGEQPEAAAVRVLQEATGIELSAAGLTPLASDDADETFFQADVTGALDVDAVNQAIAELRTGSSAYQRFDWFALDAAAGALGQKTEYQGLPWVTTQLLRAIEAGFSREHVVARANVPHAAQARVLGQLKRDRRG